jgi:hypothetical protein
METNSLANYEVLQVQTSPEQELSQMDTIERANVDMQVATAHRFPRNITRCKNNSIAIATMDEEAARSCGYALPRGNKPITGPSVHLARIIAQQYGNLRAEAKVVQITDRQVVSRGTAWDLENNYAVAFEVRRSIIGKSGQRYNDDMITVTGNAANSIAYRNAIFAAIPKAIIDAVYSAAQNLITGDISDEQKLISSRTKAVKLFADDYNISEEELVKLCGKQTINQIKANEIVLLRGFYQSLQDGDTTVDDLLANIRPKQPTATASQQEQTSHVSEILAARRAKKAAQAAATAENVDTETGEVTPTIAADDNLSGHPSTTDNLFN